MSVVERINKINSLISTENKTDQIDSSIIDKYNTFKEWLLEELVDNHFDVCAVNTEWYDWGRKIRITVSMNDLTTVHNNIKEIVESCVEQYYGDTVKEYSLFLEL